MPSITSVNDVRAMRLLIEIPERAHLRQRQIRVHRPNSVADFPDEGFGVAPIAADDEADPAWQEVANAECLVVQTGG